VQATGFIKGQNNRWPELQELAMGNDQLLRYPGMWPNFVPGDDLSGHEHNRLWVLANGRYTDMANQVGWGSPYVSRGFALGDVDGDDTLEVLVANQWEDSVLLRNVSTPTAKAADLRLVRQGIAGATRDAIGAEVRVNDAEHPYKAQLYPANGHAGVSASELHMPLPSGAPAQATVTWRDSDEIHRASVEIQPGHHTILLTSDGRAITR
jgi:enediyne biosynthesis protein E4